MKIVVQRVKSAKVSVGGKTTSEIGAGFLILVGVGKEDREEDLKYLSKKLTALRIFEDDKGKMNLDIKKARGSILSVPQFTLYADTRKGNRPGFEMSAEPQSAKKLWEDFNSMLESCGADVKEGIFGARMEVELINDGPVTILLDSKGRYV